MGSHFAHGDQIVIINNDCTGIRHFLVHDQLQESALTRSRGAHDKYELALIDLKAHILQRAGAIVVCLGDIFKLYQIALPLRINHGVRSNCAAFLF